ncbi:hypothetical protein QAD02_024070 [Eretmocerus hayati]|uniref:Uncharacterized protein n=1 Tax=Eretmocerus hayati TaxID=131215 RepID=A0ACC2Q2H7_9HYME|nr:hypothetical protein QAD02_024070 [Eretmocerus hayati]
MSHVMEIQSQVKVRASTNVPELYQSRIFPLFSNNSCIIDLSDSQTRIMRWALLATASGAVALASSTSPPQKVSVATITPSSGSQLQSHNGGHQDHQHNFERDGSLFSLADYAVLGAMLLISCLIGTFYACYSTRRSRARSTDAEQRDQTKRQTSDDFLLGGSDMGTIPMAMSLAASFVTAIELLGNPAEMYQHGTQFWMTCLAFVLVVPITSRLYLPVFMKLRLTSSYEYLNLRFNRHCRLLASGLYMLQMVLYTSVAVYAPALALSHVTGLNTYVAVSLVYVVCIFYTSQGGMKAVIMTDTFQVVVLVASLLVIAAWGPLSSGGLSSIWSDNESSGRLELFNLDPRLTVRHSLWSVTIGGTFYWTTMFCSNQASVQKYLSVDSISQVRKALWVSSIGLIFIYTVNFFTGMVLYSTYKNCDPVASGQIAGQDELLPFYVMSFMNKAKGVPGLFVAGIFAASLGTVASAMNSLAAITCEDVLQGLLGLEIPANKGAAYAKWISVFFGLLSFALVFIVERLGSVLQVALSFNGMVGGVTLGLFSLGMFVPWTNATGALTGAISSLCVVLWIGLGAQLSALRGEIHEPSLTISVNNCSMVNGNWTELSSTEFYQIPQQDVAWYPYRISYLWYSAIGCLGTMTIGFVVSYVTGFQSPADIDRDLLSPVIHRFISQTKPKSHPNQILGISNIAFEMNDEKLKIEPKKISLGNGKNEFI